MDAVTKRQMRIWLPADVEPIGIGEDRRVAVRRPDDRRHAFPRGNDRAAELDRLAKKRRLPRAVIALSPARPVKDASRSACTAQYSMD